MFAKYHGLVVSIIFISLCWYLYYSIQSTFMLIIALFVTVLVVVPSIVNYFKVKTSIKDVEHFSFWDKARIIYTTLAFMLFMVFIAMEETYGGSAASISFASLRVEQYETGNFYLSSHGDFTLVSYKIWRRMFLLESITVPMFILMFLWEFIHGVRTKGLWEMLIGNDKQRI